MEHRKISRDQILFFFILALGFFGRSWNFSSLPPGLNQDEASCGVDAYDLLHYGTDRNGETFPVHAIAFGSGQNTPYCYLRILFHQPNISKPSVIPIRMRLSGLSVLTADILLGWKIVPKIQKWFMSCNMGLRRMRPSLTRLNPLRNSRFINREG
jgi:hypothetical protein